ncbi:MAG: MEDS domain-containing protein, partial [Chloroflexota bacterium]
MVIASGGGPATDGPDAGGSKPVVVDAAGRAGTTAALRSPRTIADVQAGDHICCVYETDAELRATVTPFLREGLERGEKVVYIVDARTAEMVLVSLRDDGIDPAPFLDRGQLSILGREETYLRGGAFNPEGMIALLRSETDLALAQGYAGLRVTGEMTWALRSVTDPADLVRYEVLLNEFFPGSRCLAICQYDRRRFDPGLLLDILRTHPYVAIGPHVCASPHFVPPAAFYGSERPAAELAAWMRGLTERRQAEDALRDANWQLVNTLWGTRAGTWAWNVQTGEADFNERWAEIIGYTLDELAPVSIRTWEAHAHPDDLAQSGRVLARHFAGELPFYEFESRMRHRDGRWIWVLDRGAVATRTADGRPLMVFGTHLDITARKESEEA